MTNIELITASADITKSVASINNIWSPSVVDAMKPVVQMVSDVVTTVDAVHEFVDGVKDELNSQTPKDYTEDSTFRDINGNIVRHSIHGIDQPLGKPH